MQNADLGLPSLPGVGGSGSSDLTSLVSGSHTLRLWYAGPEHGPARAARLAGRVRRGAQRHRPVDLVEQGQERDPPHRAASKPDDAPEPRCRHRPMTPQQAADAALKAITPVDQGQHRRYGGRGRPAGVRAGARSRATPARWSSSVRIAIDGKTHVPTRVQVFAHGRGQARLRGRLHLLRPDHPGRLGVPLQPAARAPR